MDFSNERDKTIVSLTQELERARQGLEAAEEQATKYMQRANKYEGRLLSGGMFGAVALGVMGLWVANEHIRADIAEKALENNSAVPSGGSLIEMRTPMDALTTPAEPAFATPEALGPGGS